MNIDAKPWYPSACDDGPMMEAVFATAEASDGTFGGVVGTTSASASFAPTPDSSAGGGAASVRRNDPYRTTLFQMGDGGAYTMAPPYSSDPSPNHHGAKVHPSSGTIGSSHILDYSELMYNAMQRQELVDGPPSYTDFVGQPYRSAPFRSHVSVNDLEEHHGVSSGSNSGSNGSNAHTPRLVQMQQPTEKKPKPPAVPVAIPLPRSRRCDSAAPTGIPSPLDSQTASPTRAGSDPIEFPLPAPRSQQRLAPPSPAEVDFVVNEAEDNILLRLKEMLTRSHNGCPFGELTVHRSGDTTTSRTTDSQATGNARAAAVPLTTAAATTEKKKHQHGDAQLNSDEDCGTHKKVATTAAPKKKKPVPAKKKENEWKTVEHHHQGAGSHHTAAGASRAAASPTTTTTLSNKFELVAQGKSAKKRRGANEEESSDDDGGHAIVFAPTKQQPKHHHPSKSNAKTLDEDAWLEEAARAGAAAQEHHQRQALEDACSKEALLFMGVVTLNSLPNIGALLPKKPTQTQINLAASFQRIIAEPVSDQNTNARHHALRRLLDKVQGQMQSHQQMTALVVAIHVELSESASDLDTGISHLRQALHLAKSHQSLPLELLVLIAQCRFNQKLIDMADCTDDLRRSLEIALELRELRAIGWTASMVSVSLEVSGAFPESVSWQVLAWRIGHFTGDHRLEAESVSHVAISIGAVGAFDEAERLLDIVERTRPSISRPIAHRTTQNMAQIATQIGDVERALRYLLEERDFNRNSRDQHASQITHNIAAALRSMGRTEDALQVYQGENIVVDKLPMTRDTESIMGTAVCLKTLGQRGKARDMLMKVLRGAREASDNGLAAKALADIGDIDAMDGNYEEAVVRLAEGLRLIDQVAPSESKQFYTKVHLCEAEWKISEVLENIHASRNFVVDAVRFGDIMRMPNTADVMGLLQKKQQKSLRVVAAAGIAAPGDSTIMVKKAERPSISTALSVAGPRALAQYQASAQLLKSRFFDADVFRRMLADKRTAGVDSLVVFSPHWNDTFEFCAYVLSHDKEGADGGDVEGHYVPLSFSPQALRVLTGTHSAFYSTFHRSTTAAVSRQDDDGGRGSASINGDTPLFPPQYWYAQHAYAKSHPEEAKRIEHDLEYCFNILHDTFIRPIEHLLKLDASAPPRLLFIGDGAISMIPFPALLCSRTGVRLVDVCMSAKLPSVEHALTIYARRLASKALPNETDDMHAECTVITGFGCDEPRVALIRNSLKSTKVMPIIDGPASVEHLSKGLPFPTHREIEDAADASALPGLCRRLIDTTLLPRMRDKTLSNELFRAIFVDADRSAPLLLDLPVITDVKEDFSGVMTTAAGTTLVSSSEISVTWDLSPFPVVVATRFGAHGARSIHETGIPVNRALLLAGAQRLLLPLGGNTECICEESMLVPKAATSASRRDEVFHAVHYAMKALKDAGAPTSVWCAFSFFGLP